MVSLMYPNVNKHIGAESRPQLSYTQSNQVETGRIQVEQVKVPKEQARLSAPPPYSEEDPIAEQSEKGEKPSKKSKKNKKEPSLFLEVAFGYRIAKTVTEKRIQRREARLEKVHDTWMQLGVDTRTIAKQGGQLPPHFWSPPNYGPEEMSARLAQLGL